ncbi:MAG TPA: alpha/beta family hydrolase [Candidatus Solibacter sp.]|jgi:predicted alpha/beta-hydrolase family hydrolase|nr:alpha/beta family hydrolase [Candidatus Solibacter sp.]
MIYLGHGASGNAATMKPYVEGLAARGVEAASVPATGKLPTRAEKAMDVFADLLREHPGVMIGGHSYGGRVASMVAAESGAGPGGLVLFSYPLHRPGRPEELRTAHWPSITCPVLLLSGESDPFARIDLLRVAVGLLPSAELVTYPHAGHGLTRNAGVFGDALDRVAAFARRLA